MHELSGTDYELSAAQEHAVAQYKLGICLYNGRGVKLDRKKALKYFTLSADQCVAEAQYNCGRMYYHGDDVQRDVGEAHRYWELAAQSHQAARSELATGGQVSMDLVALSHHIAGARIPSWLKRSIKPDHHDQPKK